MTKTSRCITIFAAVSALTLMGCTGAQFAELPSLNEETFTQVVAQTDPYEALYATKGLPYRTVVDHSLYSTPIIDNGQPRGNSRIRGDASIEVQRASIEAIRSEASKAGMTLDQEAMVLAIAYVESGFNPDAAAGTTSAQGLGQFIRKTGAHYGLTDANRWDVQQQARALVEHTLDNYTATERAGLSDEYVYARHHDGSFNNKYGGVDLAVDRVVPKATQIRQILFES